MAKSLQQARRETAEKLEANMATAQNELGLTAEESANALLVWVDHRRLRGIPAIGRGVSGHPTDSFVPGSDEHIEEMTG